MVLVGLQTPDKFPEKVDFITSVGHLTGGNSRREAGLLGNGPQAVISPWGVYDFEPTSKRMRIKSLTPGVTADIAQQLTGFELLKPKGVIPDTKLVTLAALKIIRTQVDRRGVFTQMPAA